MPFHLRPLAHTEADVVLLELLGDLRGPDLAEQLEAAIVEVYQAPKGGVVLDGRQLKSIDTPCRAALLNHDWRVGGRMTFFGPTPIWSLLGWPLIPVYSSQQMAEHECLQRCKEARPPMESVFRTNLTSFKGGAWLHCLGSYWRPDACQELESVSQQARGDLILDVGYLIVLSPEAETILRRLAEAVRGRGDRVFFVANQISETGRRLHAAGIMDWEDNYQNPHLACAALYPNDPPTSPRD